MFSPWFTSKNYALRCKGDFVHYPKTTEVCYLSVETSNVSSVQGFCCHYCDLLFARSIHTRSIAIRSTFMRSTQFFLVQDSCFVSEILHMQLLSITIISGKSKMNPLSAIYFCSSYGCLVLAMYKTIRYK